MYWIASAITAALLSACGGSSDEPWFAKVKVAGDSLADSGTFGYQFTVQGSASQGVTPIWPELIAQDNQSTLCPHYRPSSASSFTSNAQCGNYAIGAARINYPQAPQSPLSVLTQLQALGAAGYGRDELVLVVGGGNDAADLVGAYLSASKDGGASFAALLGSLLGAANVQTLLAQGASGQAQAGGAYMQALAKQFAAAIQSQTVGKGAARAVVLNIPAITLTPRFQMLLLGIAQSQGAPVAAQLTQLFDSWTQAFNTQLAAEFKDSKTVKVANFYAKLQDLVARPASYGMSNASTPACPPTGTDSTGLPSYSLQTCSASALSATPAPAGASGGVNWWQTYVFADYFHPTPRGHGILADLVREQLKN